MIMFPKSRVSAFRHANKALRYGQAFFNFMKLEKVTNPQDKQFCNRIYTEPDESKVRQWIASRIDPDN